MISDHALIRRSSRAPQCINKALKAAGLMGGEGKGELAEELVLEFEMNSNEGSSQLKHEGRVVGIISNDRSPVFRSKGNQVRLRTREKKGVQGSPFTRYSSTVNQGFCIGHLGGKAIKDIGSFIKMKADGIYEMGKDAAVLL